MYIPKTPRIAKNVFPKLLWNKPREEKAVYLTFDDGPTPGVTEWVLDTLSEYNALATFFCVGKNVEENLGIMQRIINEGHSIGNHTYNHYNAWKTKSAVYMNDVDECCKVINSSLFRPPYGKLRPMIQKRLLKNFDIVMWDVLSYDFDEKITGEECYENVAQNSSAGSIIVFHDSVKAELRLKYALPKCLDFFASQSYAFRSL
jgi:peptidoglycan-N-acetylglucosamine deacetylase